MCNAQTTSQVREHVLVEDVFKTVEPDRKAWRLVGGVLVQRTVRFGRARAACRDPCIVQGCPAAGRREKIETIVQLR